MRAKPWLGPASIVLAVLAAYANAFGGSFQFDDFNVIVDRPAAHSIAAWWDAMPGIRPLLKLSYAANWQGESATLPFHAFNIALHAANALLVWALLGRLWLGTGQDGARASLAALAGALLFALHPAHTEAVSYVSGRSVSLMAFFYLASLLAYARGIERDARPWPGALSVLLFAAALATKETAITLPFALLLWEALHSPSRFRLRQCLSRQAAHWLVLVLALALMAANARYRELFEASLAARPLADQLLLQLSALVHLGGVLALAVAPNIDPELTAPPAWSAPAWGGLALVAALLAAGFVQLRRRPWLGFLLLWFFLQLAPTNSLLARLDPVNDRQLYLASIGPLALAGGLLAAATIVLRRSSRDWTARLGWLPLLLAALALGVATQFRNRDYRSEVALWSETARHSPGKARVFNNLGHALWQAGEVDAARRAFEQALERDPQHVRARVNLRLLDEQPDTVPRTSARVR